MYGHGTVMVELRYLEKLKFDLALAQRLVPQNATLEKLKVECLGEEKRLARLKSEVLAVESRARRVGLLLDAAKEQKEISRQIAKLKRQEEKLNQTMANSKKALADIKAEAATMAAAVRKVKSV